MKTRIRVLMCHLVCLNKFNRFLIRLYSVTDDWTACSTCNEHLFGDELSKYVQKLLEMNVKLSKA